MPSYYDILGLSPEATIDEIRRAFRREAKRLHPDTDTGTETKMRTLNEAYETLKDPHRRQRYDREIQRPTAHHQAPAGMPTEDPFRFKSEVLQPLDQSLLATLTTLDRAVEELAYDLYDDTYIARFAAAVAKADTAVSRAHQHLVNSEWPQALVSGLTLYRQGVRQVQDAIEDFGQFSLTLDADALVEGRSLLRWAMEMLDEARTALGMS